LAEFKSVDKASIGDTVAEVLEEICKFFEKGIKEQGELFMEYD